MRFPEPRSCLHKKNLHPKLRSERKNLVGSCNIPQDAKHLLDRLRRFHNTFCYKWSRRQRWSRHADRARDCTLKNLRPDAQVACPTAIHLSGAKTGGDLTPQFLANWRHWLKLSSTAVKAACALRWDKPKSSPRRTKSDRAGDFPTPLRQSCVRNLRCSEPSHKQATIANGLCRPSGN